jgi:hypothetical protein
MSRGNSNSGKSNFYFVKDQKFRQNVEAKTETSRETVASDGKVFHYEEYTEIGGLLNHIFINEEESGAKKYKTMCIQLTDSEEGVKENITMYFSNTEANSFLRRLPNIDLKKEINIVIRKVRKEGSEFINGRLDVYQEGELVELFYTKENPLPEWVGLKKADGTTVWDRTAQDKFLEELAEKTNLSISAIRKEAPVSAEDAAELFSSPTVKLENLEDLKANPALNGVVYPEAGNDGLPF